MQFVYVNDYLLLLFIPASHNIRHCNCSLCNQPDEPKRIMTLGSLSRSLKANIFNKFIFIDEKKIKVAHSYP